MEIFVIGNFDIFLRLSVALVLGGVLGVERVIAHKTAGMRTYGLASMGSALFVIVSNIVVGKYLGIVNLDPLRMASQIIVGIGFIGAGSIILKENESKVSGLTTAVGLWLSTGIGMAVGFGLYAIAIMSTVLTFFTFTVMWFLETKIKEIQEKKNNV